jgi:hypothetical protein
LFAEQNSIPTELFADIAMDELTRIELAKIADVANLQCTLCPNMSYEKYNLLVRHAVTHLGHEFYKCTGCVYQTLSRPDMYDHLATHKIPEGRREQMMKNLSDDANGGSRQAPQESAGCEVEAMPPPLYDSRQSPAQEMMSSPPITPSVLNSSNESNGSAERVSLKMVIQRKPQQTSSSHHHRRDREIYAVTRVEVDEGHVEPSPSSSSE